MLMRRLANAAGAAIFGVLSLGACGNDANDAATTTTTTRSQAPQLGDDAQAFCEANDELDAEEGPPTGEQLQELADIAPTEMKDETGVVAERFAVEGLDAFDDARVSEALGNIESWRQENCPSAVGDGDEE